MKIRQTFRDPPANDVTTETRRPKMASRVSYIEKVGAVSAKVFSAVLPSLMSPMGPFRLVLDCLSALLSMSGA